MTDSTVKVARIRRVRQGSRRRVRHATRWLLAPLAIGLAAGCGAGDTGPAVSVRDSAGVRIAENDLASDRVLATCSVESEPFVRIGARSAGHEHELYGVSDALRLADGRIAVVNSGTQDVRIFDAEGSFHLSIGRNGEGPGEFRDPIEIAVRPPDSLVVWDWELDRLSVFTADGTFVRSARLQPVVPIPTGHFGVLSEESPYVIADHVFRMPEGSQAAPQRMRLLSYGGDGVLADTLATLPYGSRLWVDRDARMVSSPLFESRAAFHVHGDRVYIARGDVSEVRIVDAAGTLRGLIRWQTPDRTVVPAEVDAYHRQRLSGASEGVRRRLQRRFEILPVAERFPAVRRVEADRLGRVWVQRYPRPSSDSQTWWAFDRDGAFACALTVPKALTVLEFGSDFLLAKATDDLEVEYVEAYDLE